MQSLPGGDLLLHPTSKDLMRSYAHCVRLKFYCHDDPIIANLVDEIVETLFTAVLHNYYITFSGSLQQFLLS